MKFQTFLLSSVVLVLIGTSNVYAQDVVSSSSGSLLSVALSVTKEDAEKRIGSFTKKPFFFKTYSGEFVKLGPDTLNELVHISEDTVGGNIHTTLTLNSIASISGILGADIERPTQDTVLTKKGDRYEVAGDLQNGYVLDQEALAQLLAQALTTTNEKTRAIELPMKRVDAKVYIVDEQGQRKEVTQVGQGESDFSGSSASRIHNIKTAMATVNGVSIAPGEVFSFNNYLGEVDGSTGYKLELVIKGTETIPEFGGGVCQVSSTVYRAALYSGLPIVERKPHSYAVSYYTPWGTDATIYPGVVDLRFQNNFPAPIILHTYMDGKKLYVNFYGEKDGRSVEMNGPNVYGHQGAPAPKVEYTTSLPAGKRVWKAYGHNGFASWWERKVTSGTGLVMTEKINSIYEARPGAVLEGKAAASDTAATEQTTQPN